MNGQISIILQLCKKEFSDNVYVKERILAAMKSTNILQEEEDKNLSLGMPVQPQEDDENGEKLENEERKLQPSPPMDEGNTQDFADDKLCFQNSDDEEEYQPMPNENIIDNDLKNDEEYGLDMLYDNALDDGAMLIDNPPCLVVTTLCEDKNDILIPTSIGDR